MDEKYELQFYIPYEMFENKEYVEHCVAQLKRRGAETVFNEIYNANHPIVVETHIESWEDNYDILPKMFYKLHYRLTAVHHRNVEIPVFTFANHLGSLEWKCPACSMINSIEATFCGEKHYNAVGCGRPRDKTRQWHEAQCAEALNV